MQFHELTLFDARKLLDAKEISSVDLVTALLKRIGNCDGEI